MMVPMRAAMLLIMFSKLATKIVWSSDSEVKEMVEGPKTPRKWLTERK